MPTLKGVTCDLYVDDSRAEEYGMTVHDNVCTVWVAAIENKEYGFEIEVDPKQTGADAHMLSFWADGQELTGNIMGEGDNTISVHEVCIGVNDCGSQVWRPLKFGKLETEEEGGLELDEDAAKHVGILEWSICRCERVWDSDTQPEPLYFESKNSINEKSVKGRAVSHCTELGDSFVVPNQPWLEAEPRDPDETPFVRFRFKYVSIDLLNMQGFIQRPEVSFGPLWREVVSLRFAPLVSRKTQERNIENRSRRRPGTRRKLLGELAEQEKKKKPRA
ncbi:hypothetical protein TWF281_004375 [Arthrobotrys megalospora]